MFFKISFSIVLAIFFSISCYAHSITIPKEVDDLKVNILADLFSNLTFLFGKMQYHNEKVIAVIMPIKYDSTMISIFDKALPKIASIWSVVFNDGFFTDNIGDFVLSYNVNMIPIPYPYMYIIPIHMNQTPSYIETQIMAMERRSRFNHSAIFLIVIALEDCTKPDYNHTAVRRLFQKMWSLNIFDTRLLYLLKCDGTATVVTGRPYHPENACGIVGKDGLKFAKFYPGEQLTTTNLSFYLPQGKNLSNCKFMVGTTPIAPYVLGKKVTVKNKVHFEYFGGMDIEFLRLFSNKYNFTYDFSKQESYELNAWFELLKNGTATGIMQDVLNHKTDMAFGGVTPSYISYTRYDNSFSYKFSSISLYTRDAELLPQWKIYFKTFPFEVWVILFFTFVSVYLLFYLMNNLDTSYPKLFYGQTFQLLSLLKMYITGLTENMNPKPWYLRVLLVSWALYVMHWNIAYQNLLFTLLTNPPHERPITTIEELKLLGLRVTMDPVYMEYFGHTDHDSVTQSLLDTHIECNSTEVCITQLGEYRNITLMEKEENVEFRLNLRKSKIRKLDDKMITYSVGFLTDQGSILIHELNNLILSCFAAGFFTKWERDVVMNHGSVIEKKSSEESHYSPLTMEDLKGCFIILLCGLGISFVVFIGELLFFIIKGKHYINSNVSLH